MSRTTLLKITAVCIGLVISLVMAEIFLRVQSFIQLDGFAESKRWHPVLHHGSDEFVVTNYGKDCSNDKIKLLLLGDSWMEDPVLSGTIGKELAAGTGRCIETVNGGTSSYAPTLYQLKGRQAVQKYGSFDYVIVNVDETDIGDEWLRYRVPQTRDETGKLVAVPFENDIRSLFIRNGKLWAEDSPIYLLRFLRFALFYNILVPYLEEFTVAPNHYDTLMRYVFAPEAATSYAEEQDYFYARLVELTAELKAAAGEDKAVYVTHHPHLRGLTDKVEDGKKYLPVVSQAVARLGRETGVQILDARSQVDSIHGEALQQDTYVEGDPFSHLAEAGATRYGKWIADQVVVNIGSRK